MFNQLSGSVVLVVSTLAAVAAHILALFSPLKKFQFGHHKVYNMFALLVSIAVLCISDMNRQESVLSSYNLATIAIGLMCFLSMILFSHQRYSHGMRYRLVGGIVLYVCGSALVTFGLIESASRYVYFSVSGRVVRIADGKELPVAAVPVALETDTPGLAFEVMTDASGIYKFRLTDRELLSSSKVSVCNVYNPPVFRFINFDTHLIEGGGKDISIIPPLKVPEGRGC